MGRDKEFSDPVIVSSKVDIPSQFVTKLLKL